MVTADWLEEVSGRMITITICIIQSNIRVRTETSNLVNYDLNWFLGYESIGFSYSPISLWTQIDSRVLFSFFFFPFPRAWNWSPELPCCRWSALNYIAGKICDFKQEPCNGIVNVIESCYQLTSIWNFKDVSSEIYTTLQEKEMSPGADSYNLTKKITTHSAVDFIFLYSVTIQERLKYIIDVAVYSCSEDRVPTLIPRDKSRSCFYFPVVGIKIAWKTI